MSTQKVTLNLTPLFIVWSAVFVLVTMFTGDLGWLWWAAAPWLFVLGFVVLALIIGTAAFGLAYWRGTPITVTDARGRKRTVQRRVR